MKLELISEDSTGSDCMNCQLLIKANSSEINEILNKYNINLGKLNVTKLVIKLN